jgi:hypothetical protein
MSESAANEPAEEFGTDRNRYLRGAVLFALGYPRRRNFEPRDEYSRCPSRRGVGRQHLPHIRLGYAKLPRNLRRFDPRFKRRTNGIDLPTRQRDLPEFSLPLVPR